MYHISSSPDSGVASFDSKEQATSMSVNHFCLWYCLRHQTSISCASQTLGDPLIDSVVSDNIPLLTADEKFNETVTSIAKRVGAVLNSEPYVSTYRCS